MQVRHLNFHFGFLPRSYPCQPVIFYGWRKGIMFTRKLYCKWLKSAVQAIVIFWFIVHLEVMFSKQKCRDFLEKIMLHIAVYLDYCAWQLEAQWLIFQWAVSGGQVLIFLLNVSQWMCFYSPYWKKLLEWCPWDCKYVSHQTNPLFIAHQNSFGVTENTIFWIVSYRPSLMWGLLLQCTKSEIAQIWQVRRPQSIACYSLSKMTV